MDRETWILYSFLLGTYCIAHCYGEAYNYHFMEEMCDPNGTTVDLSQETSTYGYVKVVRDGGYSPNLDCKMYLVAPVGHKLTARFQRIETYMDGSTCSTDYIIIYDGDGQSTICGHGSPRLVYTTVNRTLGLEFHSGDWNFDHSRIGFSLYYTSFHEGECDTEDGELFQCDIHDRCIPGELKCDDLDNCGDWSDEKRNVCGWPVASIVAVSVTSVLCCGFCIAGAIYWAYDKKHDTTRRSRRRQNQIRHSPTVGYSARGQHIVDADAPPPYSSYFTTPPYTEHKADKDLPPAYSNLVFDSPTNIASTDGTAQITQAVESTNNGTSDGTAESVSTAEPTDVAITTTGRSDHSLSSSPSTSRSTETNSHHSSSSSRRSTVVTPPTGGSRSISNDSEGNS